MDIEHGTYLIAIREESERFLEALAGIPGDAPVPSCAGWTAADLLWHLTDVQYSWAQVVSTGVTGDDVAERPRPTDVAGLRALAARSGTELLAALAAHDPHEPCWSWHEDGGTVGWVARRQAHEALIHRVDADLTAGRAAGPPSAELAADGVDELLRVMLDGVPDWGTFTPDGVTVAIACDNVDASWVLALGRFTGTSATSGTTYDLDAAAVLDEDDGGADDLTLNGSAWDLDRWLWGRGTADALTISGDRALLERLRALVTEATQ
ncbi:maleylpyruvate isomerase family mycothiol-dependent enzyme [Cellulomonas sp. KRMCY2]|uniref:maleylpyruvate isomerase family mycothiol-dependent enzyme n=1 Tax=Cellulomonas sp. KRMCY2 TaxID=1304865 RepID=UPI00045E60C4|nr:maleylpyruvate isomerase family mycothiol-dependent enzyme [Cellulomonas sp. KRMCY2]